MKELSIEEKAKAYDEALEKSKRLYEQGTITESLCYVFPELKESEDGRIRKEIIHFLDTAENQMTQEQYISCENRWIPWLKKQGEKKPTAEEVLIKAGLKPYKDGNQWCILVGDNIQEGICGFGDTIEDALYDFLKEICETKQKQGEQKPVEIEETELRSFNEGYAQGVISEKSKPVEWSTNDEFVIKILNTVCDEYLRISTYKGTEFRHEVIDAKTWLKDLKDRVLPQPKQEWSEEDSKWAEEIRLALRFYSEDKAVIERLTNWFDNHILPKQEWSEEDENHRKDAILAIQEYRADCIKKYGKDPAWADCVDWLKSLKDRVLPQPKQEWSEEDEKKIKDIIYLLKQLKQHDKKDVYPQELINFLKSLRPQKPEWSEEDKNLREATIGLLNLVQPHDAKSWGKSRYDCIDWLRNLRPKNNAYHEGFKNGFAKARGMGYKQWKPTEEQIKALQKAMIDLCGKDEHNVITGLYYDLKTV